jgi:hypothetical protein
VISWDLPRLKQTRFYRDNQAILDRHRGYGYWLWKPYIISEALAENPRDTIIYCDVGKASPIMVTAPIAPLVDRCHHHGGILPGTYIPDVQGHCTKRDCFYLMGCDEPKFWESRQVLATWSIWHGSRAVEFVAEWLAYCLDRWCLTDDPSECGLPELPGYIGRRHDQSIVTNLCVRRGLDVYPSFKGRPRDMNAAAAAANAHLR